MLRLPVFAAAILMMSGAYAQQFVGSTSSKAPGIDQAPYNPAWTATAESGTEIRPFAASGLAGSNAWRFRNEFVSGGFSGRAVEGKDYFKDPRTAAKHVWGNIDVLGPAASFRVKPDVSVGVYTRIRELIRGGNVSAEAFRFIGDNSGIPLGKPVTFRNAGFTTHTFSEIGFSYGRVLRNDYYHIFRGGVNVKYVMGMAAGSIYTDEAVIVKSTADSISSLRGNLQASYSKNSKAFVDEQFSNDFSSWFNRGGQGGLGLDIGIQYEYHPDGNPNEETPYLYSLAVSLTDIGAIRYTADTGSAQYLLDVNEAAGWQYARRPYESNLDYFHHLTADSFITRKEETKSFSVGLPTAFRVNFDWNLAPRMYLQANVLLNLKGSSGGIYSSGYVNMFQVAPRYEQGYFSVALPFTFIGYQTMNLGLAFHAGPFYAGSSSIFSNLIGKQTRSLDLYAGLSFKFKREHSY